MVYEGMCKIRFDEMRMDMNDRGIFGKSLHLRYSGHSLPGLCGSYQLGSVIDQIQMPLQRLSKAK